MQGVLISGVEKYTNVVFGMAKINVSSILRCQSVLIEGFHCIVCDVIAIVCDVIVSAVQLQLVIILMGIYLNGSMHDILDVSGLWSFLPTLRPREPLPPSLLPLSPPLSSPPSLPPPSLSSLPPSSLPLSPPHKL